MIPTDDWIRVAAPESITETAIRIAVIHRIPWTHQQQANLANQIRRSTREIISEETHYLWGRLYRPKVIEVDTTQSLLRNFKLKGSKFILTVSTGTSTADRLKTSNEYYCARLKARAHDLINKCFKKIDVTA